MTKPRPHAEIIRAWADGHDVQYRRPGSNEWVDSPDPAFVSDYEYRVKPARKYPVTMMRPQELKEICRSALVDSSPFSDHAAYANTAIANAALRHAIDNGQVVTREEFDRAIGDRKARDMAVARKVANEVAPDLAILSAYLEDIIANVKPQGMT